MNPTQIAPYVKITSNLMIPVFDPNMSHMQDGFTFFLAHVFHVIISMCILHGYIYIYIKKTYLSVIPLNLIIMTYI